MWVISDTPRHLVQRVMGIPSPRGPRRWRKCVGAHGAQLGSLSKLGWGRSFPRCQTDVLERNDRLWVGPQTTESSAASQPPGSPWQQLSSLLFWKWIMWLLALGNYHWWNFFSCVLSEKGTHKPCLQTVHSRIIGINQYSFKNDVAIYILLAPQCNLP